MTAPIVTPSAGTINFVEGDNTSSLRYVIDPGMTIADADSTTFASATISITSGYQSGADSLTLNGGITPDSTTGNIRQAWSSATGVLTLASAGATATLAQWQAALRQVTFTNSSQTPTSGDRTISFILNDGASNSAAVSKTVNVSPVNDFTNLGVGRVSTDLGGTENAQAITFLPDGKILVAGSSRPTTNVYSFAEARYNSDGSLDTTFGTAGIRTTGFVNGATGNAAFNTVLGGDGKATLIGYIVNDGTLAVPDTRWAIARYNGDGSLDTSFDVDGKQTYDLRNYANPNHAAVQADGKILVTGDLQINTAWSNTGLLRLNADGSIDTGFGINGLVTFDSGTDSAGWRVLALPDGKIMVVSSTFPRGVGLDCVLSLTRLNGDGSLDTSFDGDGIATTNIAGGATTPLVDALYQTDGKTVVLVVASDALTAATNAVLLRYNTDGTLDTSFDGDGKVTLSGINPRQVTLQSDGKLLLAGGSRGNFAVIRYNPDGSVDTSFGTAGKVTTDFGTTGDVAYTLALDATGKLLVAGGSNGNFALARYNIDGSPDSSFAGISQPVLGGSVLLDSHATITDPEMAVVGYGGATLTIERAGGASANDVFVAKPGGTLGALTEGSNLTIGTTVIGTVTSNHGGTLQLNFTSGLNGSVVTGASQTLVNGVLQQLAYSNPVDPVGTTVQIGWTFSDGNAGAQGPGGAQTMVGSSSIKVSVENGIVVSGTPGNDALGGGTGNDYITGGLGTDSLTGGAGSDLFGFWTAADDLSTDTVTDFVAGVGGDSISAPTSRLTNYTSGANPFTSGHVRLTQSGADMLVEVDVDGAVGPAVYQTMVVLSNVIKTNLVASNFNGADPKANLGTDTPDSLAGTSSADQLNGGGGNDTVSGLTGNDTLYGGEGNDLVDGGAGNDLLFGNDGNDSIVGGANFDSLYGGAGDDTLDGGSETDSAFYSDATGGVTADLTASTVTGPGVGTDTLINIEQIYGSQYADTLIGGAGNDSLFGQGGNDSITGGAGYDNFVGGAGNDTLDGGADSDSVQYYDATGPVTVNLELGTASGTGIGTDTLISIENVYGSQYADVLTGSANNDTLSGGLGNDTLTGGAGSDYFQVRTSSTDTSVDTITDFTAGKGGKGGSSVDNLYFSTSGFTNYTGVNPFASGHALLTQSGADTLLQVDTDGPTGANAFQTVAILSGVSKGNLVASNLNNWDPTVTGFFGGATADALSGTAGNDYMDGGAGNDTLTGLGGNDTIYGGLDNDVIDGGDGNDRLYGNDGNDTLTGGLGSDFFQLRSSSTDTSVDAITDFAAGNGGDNLYFSPSGFANYTGVNPFVSGHAQLTQSGADTLLQLDTDGPTGPSTFQTIAILNGVSKANLVANNINGWNPSAIGGTAGADSIDGTAGNDYIDGAGDNDTINGLAGDDQLYGGSGDDVINGGDGNDQLYGNDGNDSITGSAGYDYLYGGAGDDRLDGGADSDWVYYDDASSPVTVNLELGTASGTGIGTDTLISIDNVNGSQYADTLIGDANNNSLFGDVGNDTLTGGAGSDYFQFWNNSTDTSVDTITDFAPGNGGDRLYLPTWRLSNYTGSNPFASGHALLTQSGADTLLQVDTDGPTGANVFQTIAILSGVSKANLVANNINGWNPSAIGGTAGADSIDGTAGNDYIDGAGDNDTINGLAGDDQLYGGSGDDVIDGGDGNDQLYGNDGNDSITGGAGYDNLNGGLGDDRLDGGADNDNISYSVATGPITVNLALGTATGAGIGTDTLISIENVYGSQYADVLTGSANNDTLSGGLGNDTLTGGAGSDYFQVRTSSTDTSVDTITDFTAGKGGKGGSSVDNLYFSTSGFTNYTGVNPFASGHALLTQSGADTMLQLDTDGPTGANAFQTIAILSGVSKGNLVASNLNNWDPTVTGFFGGATADALSGTAGVDYIDGAGGNDTLTGLAGNDTIYGGLDNDVIDGGDGNDQLYGNDGNDSMSGGAGNDNFVGGAGNDTLDGGADSDSVQYYDATGPVTVNLELGTASGTGIGTDTLISIDNVNGSQYADTLIGDANNNSLFGDVGNDTLTGGAGSDYFQLRNRGDDSSVDTITDFTAGVGGDRIWIPTFQFTNYTGSNPFASGHALLTQSGADTLLQVDTDGPTGANAFQTVAILSNVSKASLVANNLNGYDPNAVVGTSRPDSMTGTVGNDNMDGAAGNDTINGFAGNDTLTGGPGDDFIDGGAGSDTAVYSSSKLADWTITARGDGSFELLQPATGERDALRNIENVQFQDSSKTLAANFWASPQANGMNNISGSEFGDMVDADALAAAATVLTYRDWINTGAGNDSIKAGQGGDEIDAGAGNDTIDGGEASLAARLSALLASLSANTGELENRARYSGPANRYEVVSHVDDAGSVTGTAGGTFFTVKDLRLGSPDGTDTVFNVDALQFSDKQVRLTPNVWVNRGWDPVSGQPNNTVLGLSLEGTSVPDSLGADTTGFSGSDRLTGNQGNDTLRGGAGADTLRGDEGNDRLDGGANRAPGSTQQWDPNGSNGFDVAEYAGKAERYTIARLTDTNSGTVTGVANSVYYTVTDSKLTGGDGIDILTNIEVLRFADGERNLEVVTSPNQYWVMDPVTRINTLTVVGTNWNGTDWADNIDAAASELASGKIGKDNVRSGAGNDTIKTGGGGDFIEPGQGNDTVDGGANGTNPSNPWENYDIVRYDASQNRFTIALTEDANGNRTFAVTDKVSAEFGGLGTDTLSNVEILQFNDGNKELQVSFDMQGGWNQVRGTDFSDTMDTDALLASSLANLDTLTLRSSEPGNILISPAGLTATTGQKFVAVLGQTVVMNGVTSFQQLMEFQSGQQIAAQISLTAQANGKLAGSYEFSNLNGRNIEVRVYGTDAQGFMTGVSLASLSATLVSNRDNITASGADDVVYAGAGGDNIMDSAGNDFYDGGADGVGKNSWENPDRANFSGAQKRYLVEVLKYAELAVDSPIKAKIDAKYASNNGPANVVRVTDKVPDGDGVNYLINVEQIQFTDGVVNLGVTLNQWSPPPQFGQNDVLGSNNYTGGILNDLINASAHDNASLAQVMDGFHSNRDWLDGGLGNDTLLGGAGADQLQGGRGDDVLDGGANPAIDPLNPSQIWDKYDEARYSNSINRYDISFYRLAKAGETAVYDETGLTTGIKAYVVSAFYDPNGFIVVKDHYTDAMGGDGRDVLRNIETLVFSDSWEQLKLQSNDYVDPNSGVTNHNVYGSRFGDRIEGISNNQNYLQGNGGNDSITGGDRRDELTGGPGNDTLDGGANPAFDPTRPWEAWNTFDVAHFDAQKSQFQIDRLTDDASGIVTGHANQLYYQVTHLIPAKLGGLGTDIVFNIERLQFSGSDGDVQLQVRVDQSSYFNGSEYIVQANYHGTMFADSIVGTSGVDNMDGGAGDDTIDAGAGNDFLAGGGGNDQLMGGVGDDQFGNLGSGNDSVDGGTGFDRVIYDDAMARYSVQQGQGVFTVTDRLAANYGGEGVDQLTGVEVIRFSNGELNLANAVFNADGTVAAGQSLTTTDTNHFLVGGAGNDTLTGLGGNDNLLGNGGNDSITGGSGDDVLVGGAGQDTMDGGSDGLSDGSNGGGGDVAFYPGAPRARLDILGNSDGSFTIIDIASISAPVFLGNGHLDPACYDNAAKISSEIGYGVDTLTGIERVQFGDGQIDLAKVDRQYTWQSSWWNGQTQVNYQVTRHDITGTFLDDVLMGSVYGDQIDGRAGNDTIDGGVETATIGNPWEIQDVVRYEGSRERYEIKGVLVQIAGTGSSKTYTVVNPIEATADAVFGLQIRDVLSAANGGSGTDLLVNVERVDFAAGSSSNGSNSINIKPEYNYFPDMSLPEVNGVRPQSLNVRGTDFDDALNGTPNNDWLGGNAGNDTLVGGAGGDDFEGGTGDDLILGGVNGATDQWGNVRSDTAHYNAPLERFEITSVLVDLDGNGSKETTALQVRDLLPSDDSSSLGTDILVGVESLGFNNRWVDVGVRRWEWTDSQQRINANAEGTVFDDVILGDTTTAGVPAAVHNDQMRGNAGNDVLMGGGSGDNLQGGEGNDVIDGGANGTSGNTWLDQDQARYVGNASQYVIQSVAINTVGAESTIWANGQAIATFNSTALTITGTGLANGVADVLQLAYKNLNLADGQHQAGYLVVDTLSADLGGEGADLVFNVETLWFANGPLEIDIRANTSGLNATTGRLDWANVTGTANADAVDMAKIVTLTGKTEEQLVATRIDVDLREGNDVYIGGSGGESIRTGPGNDYVDGDANTGTDQWGNALRDEVRFEGNFSRYNLIDVTLTKTGANWALNTATAGLTVSGAAISALSGALVSLDRTELNAAIDTMIAKAGSSQTSVNGWLVADRLPSVIGGSGVDALVNIEALSFSDKWMPLSMQVYYQRDVSLNVISAYVDGTQGNDTIGFAAIPASGAYNYSGDDNLRGNEGNDVINGGPGGDWISGGAGDDLIDGGSNGTVDQWGNIRTDTVQYSGDFDRYTVTAHPDGSVTVIDSQTDGDGRDTLINVEALGFKDRYLRMDVQTWVNKDMKTGKVVDIQVNGSMLSETIDVSADSYPGLRHVVRGNEGNDTLIGGAGPDEFEGGAGDDSIIGGANGKDAWGNAGFDVARYPGAISRYTIEYSADGATWTSGNPGGAGLLVRVTDSFSATDGGQGVDTLSGIEAIAFFDRFMMIEVSKTVQDLNGDGVPDTAEITGTDSADNLVGDATNDHIRGNAGNDTLLGGKGGDILNGGAGDDSLDGGADGADAQGRKLIDVAEYSGASTLYTMTRNVDGSFTVSSTVEGTDTLTNIEGLQFSDRFVSLIQVTNEQDLNKDGVVDLIDIRGLDLANVGDVIAPATGKTAIAHHIAGGYGNDTLTGGSTSDVIEGGAGNDAIDGGGGTDRAVFSASFASYTITYSTDGATWVTTNPGGNGVQVRVTGTPDGTDTLTSIEELAFSDKVVKLGAAAVVTTKEVDTDGNQKVDTAYTTGTDGTDVVNFSGSTLINFIDTGAGDDSMTGGNGADTFSPGAGNDTVVGGANAGLDAAGSPNVDRVVFSGAKADYTVKTLQSARFAISGAVEVGDIVSVTVGSVSVSYTATASTLAALKTGLDAAIGAAKVAGTLGSAVTVTSALSPGDSQIDYMVKTTDVLAAVAATASNGTHSVAGSFAVSSDASQTGSSLKVASAAGLTAGMLVSYAVTAGTTSTSYGPYKIASISGTTLSLTESLGASPTAGSALTVVASNTDTSLAAGSVAYDRWFEVATKTVSVETDTLREIEQLVFSDGVMDLSFKTSEKAVFGATGLTTVIQIQGTDLADVMRSSSANEIFSGGSGSDHFVFTDGSGTDEIRGFVAGSSGDLITLLLGVGDSDGLNATGVDTTAEALARASQQGGDVMIDLGAGNSIRLTGVMLDDLRTSNFEVVAAF